MRISAGLLLMLLLLLCSCGKDDEDDPNNSDNNQGNSSEAMVNFRFKFDPEQERTNSIGQTASLPSGHASQSPDFNSISAHYIELAPTAFTQLGEGQVLYQGAETTSGGEKAVDYAQASVVDEGELFFSIPLSQIAAGTYEWIRVSLSYQNYDIDFKALGLNLRGTIASFIAYNTYIESHTVKQDVLQVNENRRQGYWAFETQYQTVSGQAPEGATTVPNPLFDSAPIPAGSCVVTGDFPSALQITGNETEDIEIELSLSTNNSFEWIDNNGNGLFEPLDGELVVDMGIRGMQPSF